MDADCAESQTSIMSRVLLTKSLRLKRCIKESSYKDTIPFDLITKVHFIVADMFENVRDLNVRNLTQSVPLEHIHFFFTVLHMNMHNVYVSFTPYLVYVYKLMPRSTADTALDNMKFLDEFLSLLFHSGFADPTEGEESHLRTKKSEIRILLKNIKSMIPDLQEQLETLQTYDKGIIYFVKDLQEYSNPVAACLAASPSTVCIICNQQEMTEEVGFAAVECCPQVFCVPCLKKHLKKQMKCPGCKGKISVTVSSSYMKRPTFMTELPEKYDMIVHRNVFVSRLW